jgi:hypothetical protein
MPGTSSIVLRIALVILLGALTACKSPVRAAPAPDPLPSTLASGPAVDGPHGKTTTVMLAGGWIEVTLTAPESGAAPFPVVISPILPDDELLTHGFAVVRFRTNWESLRAFAKPAVEATPRPEEAEAKPAETEPAAEPVGKWLLTAKRPGIVGRFYFDLITVDAEQSLPAVVDWLETRDDIDVRRIAVTGSSTGGFKALQAMAIEPRIAVGVVRVACGDYLTFLKSSSLALNDDPRWLPGGKLVLDPDYAVEIAAREPIRHADRYPPRPLLLLAGERDPAIPFACVENTVSRFRTAYAKDDASDRFRFVPFAEEGHNLSSAANAEILPWLERWLSHDISAAAR